MKDYSLQSRLFAGTSALFLILGCGLSSDPGADPEVGSDMDDMAAMLDSPEQTMAAEPEAEGLDTQETPEEPTVVTARDPKRGKVFHEQGGYYNALFSARFVAENKILFAQIKKTMDLFEATHGRKPNSHEEFMQKIVGEGGIRLPELEETDEYWYDAEDGDLKKRAR